MKVTDIQDRSARTFHSEGWTPWPWPEGRKGPAKGMSDTRDPQVTSSSRDSPPESGLCLRGEETAGPGIHLDLPRPILRELTGGLPAPNLGFLSIRGATTQHGGPWWRWAGTHTWLLSVLAAML